MLARIKKKPSRVTMFGASHSGRILTKAFHYHYISVRALGGGMWEKAYPWTEDVFRDRGLVNCRVLVGSQVNKSIVRDALGFYK